MRLTKILPIVALSLFPGTSFSRVLFPTAVPESKWINSYFEQVEGRENLTPNDKRFVWDEEFSTLKIDSVIKETKYLVADNCTETYAGGSGDHEEKVLFVPINSSVESIVSDFNASQDDKLQNILSRTSSGKDVLAISLDSTLIGDEISRQINYDGRSWIEGFACTHGFFMPHELSSKYMEVMPYICKGELTAYPTKKSEPAKLPKDLKKGMGSFTDIINVNPSRGWFIMKFDRRVDKAEVTIIDSKGRLIKPYMAVRPDRITVDLSTYENGNYVVIIRNKENMTLGRLSKI